MKFDVRFGIRYLASIFLLSCFQLGCSNGSDGPVETDCGEVQRKTTIFIEKSILPIVDSSQPKIDRALVEQFKDIRETVRVCSIRDVPHNSAPSRDADFFLRLHGQLGYLLVPLEQVVESDDPRLVTILASSPEFRESVQDVRATLGGEDGSGSGSNGT